MFIIPGIIIANLLKKRGESFLRVNRQPKSIHIIMVLLLALFMIPLTSYTGMLNSKLDLPVWLSGVEEWMRTKEAIASDIIALFIRSSGIGELFINIFILAIIPSVAEEIIFRGIFQQLLCGIFKSKHLGIWIAAILFSAIHFQFFGFVPRLILGLSFGYLFFWSGNLWLPVLAHFINNFVPVVMSYFFGWGNLNDNTKEIAGKQVGLPLLAATLCAVIFYYFWTEYKKDQVNGK